MVIWIARRGSYTGDEEDNYAGNIEEAASNSQVAEHEADDGTYPL